MSIDIIGLYIVGTPNALCRRDSDGSDMVLAECDSGRYAVEVSFRGGGTGRRRLESPVCRSRKSRPQVQDGGKTVIFASFPLCFAKFPYLCRATRQRIHV